MGKRGSTFTAIIQVEKFYRCTSERLQKYLQELDSEAVKIEKFITPNVLVFRTGNPKKAGKEIEVWLFRHFKKKV
jgi:hypothetical protein